MNMVDRSPKGDGRELWLFTIRFPFGNGEAFLESELPILARGFTKVVLFPLMPEGAQRKLPENVEVVRLLGTDAYKAVGPLQVLMDLRRWLHDPGAVRAGTAMPRLPLTDPQIDELVVWLGTLHATPTPPTSAPSGAQP